MKNLLKKIGDFLKNLIEDVVDIVETKSPVAVRIVQRLKEAIEFHQGSIDWVLEKTAIEQDNEAFKIVKEKLPAVAKELAVIEGLVGDSIAPEDALPIYMEYVASKAKKARAKEFVLLAALILQAIITKKLPLEILIVATQKAYHLIFGKVV